MVNWLFLIVVAFLIGMGIYGLKKGFIKALFSLVSLILTIVLTVIVSPYVSDYLKNKTELFNVTKERVCEFIDDAVLNMEEEAGESKTIDELPIPDVIKDLLKENNNEESYSILGVDNLSDYIGAYAAGMVVNAIAFLGTFIVILILINIIVHVLDVISKLPILNGVNKITGMLLGLIEGFIILWILCLLVTASASTELGRSLLAMINENEFLSFIYNNNYLMRVVSDALKVIL